MLLQGGCLYRRMQDCLCLGNAMRTLQFSYQVMLLIEVLTFWCLFLDVMTQELLDVTNSCIDRIAGVWVSLVQFLFLVCSFYKKKNGILTHWYISVKNRYIILQCFPIMPPHKWGTYNSYHISCFVDLYMSKALRPSYVFMMIYLWKHAAEHLFGV